MKNNARILLKIYKVRFQRNVIFKRIQRTFKPYKLLKSTLSSGLKVLKCSVFSVMCSQKFILQCCPISS
eukprot:UN03744